MNQSQRDELKAKLIAAMQAAKKKGETAVVKTHAKFISMLDELDGEPDGEFNRNAAIVRMEARIRANPWRAVAIALGVGMMIGSAATLIVG